MLSLCQRINTPVKLSKIKGPTIHLTYLGILIDTRQQALQMNVNRTSDHCYNHCYNVNTPGPKALSTDHDYCEFCYLLLHAVQFTICCHMLCSSLFIAACHTVCYTLYSLSFVSTPIALHNLGTAKTV